MDPLAPPAAPAPLQQPIPLVDPPFTTLPPVQVVSVTSTPSGAGTTTTAAPPSRPAPPSHPPYAQMITEAITSLKERNGSSKVAIAKYIERTYSNLPGTHSALLTQHLKRLKETGQLVMVKHSYKLAGSAGEVQSNGPKRGPGRPPKAKPAAVNGQSQQQPQVNATAGPGPISVQSGPASITESVFESLGLVDGPVKKRGRPKKVGTGVAGVQALPGAVKKRPGRPSKKAVLNAQFVSATGRTRGRPPKSGSGRPRGRPPKNAAAPATVLGAAAPILVPTGYVAETATVPAPAPALPTSAVVPTLKRRGRPPRAADAPKKPRKLSGKPLGRPKKKEAATAVPVSNVQQLLVNQEFRTKMEIFQSKIQQTVEVLKPFLNVQSAPNALAALQELEELATADVTAPLNLQSRQPPPPENRV